MNSARQPRDRAWTAELGEQFLASIAIPPQPEWLRQVDEDIAIKVRQYANREESLTFRVVCVSDCNAGSLSNIGTEKLGGSSIGRKRVVMVEVNRIARPKNLHDCHGDEGSSAIEFRLGQFDSCRRPCDPKDANDEWNEKANMPPGKARDAGKDGKEQDRQKVRGARAARGGSMR